MSAEGRCSAVPLLSGTVEPVFLQGRPLLGRVIGLGTDSFTDSPSSISGVT